MVLINVLMILLIHVLMIVLIIVSLIVLINVLFNVLVNVLMIVLMNYCRRNPAGVAAVTQDFSDDPGNVHHLQSMSHSLPATR